MDVPGGLSDDELRAVTDAVYPVPKDKPLIVQDVAMDSQPLDGGVVATVYSRLCAPPESSGVFHDTEATPLPLSVITTSRGTDGTPQQTVTNPDLPSAICRPGP
jgi:hypothetical protein